MPLVNINFDETPDKMLPIGAGIRTLTITDAKVDVDDDGNQKVTVELQVNQSDADDHERKAWDVMNMKYAPARIKFKQLVKAAGGAAAGKEFELTDLIGTTVKAAVKPRTYKDKDTEETVETTNIQKYLSGTDAN